MTVTFPLILEDCERKSQLARNASTRARAEGTVDAHRDAIEAHRLANIAWTRAHRVSIRTKGPRETQRMTYRRYVSHYDSIKRHFTRCVELGTRRGLSFPYGAPCGPTKEYLLGPGRGTRS